MGRTRGAKKSGNGGEKTGTLESSTDVPLEPRITRSKSRLSSSSTSQNSDHQKLSDGHSEAHSSSDPTDSMQQDKASMRRRKNKNEILDLSTSRSPTKLSQTLSVESLKSSPRSSKSPSKSRTSVQPAFDESRDNLVTTEEKERKKLVLHISPLRTLHYFVLEALCLFRDYGFR